MRGRLRGERERIDLVDRTALAERLGARSKTVDRWLRRGVLPRPVMTFQNEPIWSWTVVNNWAAKTSRTLRSPKQDFDLQADLVGLQDIAERLNVDMRAVEKWHYTSALPAPDYRWQVGDAWFWETIEEWANTTGRTLSRQLLRRSVVPPQGSSAGSDEALPKPATPAPVARTAPQSEPARTPAPKVGPPAIAASSTVSPADTTEPESDRAAVGPVAPARMVASPVEPAVGTDKPAAAPNTEIPMSPAAERILGVARPDVTPAAGKKPEDAETRIDPPRPTGTPSGVAPAAKLPATNRREAGDGPAAPEATPVTPAERKPSFNELREAVLPPPTPAKEPRIKKGKHTGKSKKKKKKNKKALDAAEAAATIAPVEPEVEPTAPIAPEPKAEPAPASPPPSAPIAPEPKAESALAAPPATEAPADELEAASLPIFADNGPLPRLRPLVRSTLGAPEDEKEGLDELARLRDRFLELAEQIRSI